MSLKFKSYSLSIFLLCFMACNSTPKNDGFIWKSIDVTATAYNSVKSQTSNEPNITAWGDTLVPGMKSIAVSRNLIALGLKHNTQVKIEGLKGTFIINDKMHRKWQNRIDIYMGLDIVKAKEWGKQKKKIHYRIKAIDTTNIKTN